ncbi:hypothetical protein DM02DRAFT_83359 [Periconia macrospinosa]|uniref:Ubiquitin-like domain-containing protein n=1 Tax=Periconia macrospinosa TaxID=97972 RepID=A0A2V1E4K8_9PLEO|nr:hypothetical protein DM02DRAFT_83359 [Periconia macrospinosa]
MKYRLENVFSTSSPDGYCAWGKSRSYSRGDVIKFEDGLGRIFDLPYQWFHNWRTFQGFLQDQFHGAAGERYVASDRYHLLNSVHGRLIQKPFHSWSRSVYPGAKIAMSMAVNESLLPMYECPKCNTQLNYDYTDTIIHRPRHRCWTGYKADNTPRMNERDYSRSKEHLTHEPQALDSSASTGEINSPYANMETTSESDIDDFQQDADELEAEVRCFNRIHFQSPPRELPRVPKKAIEDSSRDFACPFYKHNPQRHYPCSGPSLTILRLKEHLFRCHKTS